MPDTISHEAVMQALAALSRMLDVAPTKPARWHRPTTLRADPDELAAGLRGRWLVVTQGSSHEWDLDAMTYMRIPGPNSHAGSFALDGQRMAITRIERWPRVGSTSLVWYDDPTSPDLVEHWRQSSQIVSITRMT